MKSNNFIKDFSSLPTKIFGIKKGTCPEIQNPKRFHSYHKVKVSKRIQVRDFKAKAQIWSFFFKIKKKHIFLPRTY